MQYLSIVRLALRITTEAFDAELENLIKAAMMDLELAGVLVPYEYNELIAQAIIAYCKWRFGEPEDPDRLQKLYETQKGQLMIATGYTIYNED